MFSEQHKKKVETTAVNAAGIPLEGPTVMTQGLPAGLTPGLEFKKIDQQTLVSSGAAVPPLASTGQLPAAAAIPIGTQQTFVEKIPVTGTQATEFRSKNLETNTLAGAPLASTTALPATGFAAPAFGAAAIPVGTQQTFVEKIPATSAALPAAAIPVGTQQTFVEKIPATAVGTAALPAANLSALPPAAQGFVQGGVIPPVGTHQTFVEKIPVTESQATEFRRKSLETNSLATGVPLTSTSAALPAAAVATTAVAATAVAATTAATAAPVLTYTGIQYDIPCYIFSWSDDLHIEIPKVAKKAIGTSRATTGAVNVINEAVYAHKGRHLPGRKKRQRWIFSKEGLIISEYHPDYVLTCFNNTVTVQRREAIATGLPAATVGAPLSSLASTGVCQQWILKPSTDSNYFYICCAKNPSLAIDIEKTGELIHKGYPLVVRPLGNLSTAWSYDPK